VLHGTSYDWQFVPTGGGTFTDSGSRACGGQDTQPPTAPANLTATATSSARVDLSWGASTDNVGVTDYRVYRDNARIATAGGTRTTYADTTVGPATTHTYEVSAIDAGGRESPRSNAATVTTPPAPPGFTHVFAPTDDAYVEQGAPNTNLGTEAGLIVDASPTDNLLLRFGVATAGCDITGAKLRLTVGAAAGDGSLKGGAFSSITSAWSESTVTWANAPPAGPTVVASLGAVSPGQTYEVDVSSAVTADGPVSLRAGSTSSSAARYVSKEGSATLGPRLVVTCREDVQPPTAPANLRAHATSSARVDVTWDPSTDDVGVTGYRVYRDNARVATTGGSVTTYADSGVSAATTYTYQVSAIDAAGRESPRSNAATVTTPPPPGLTHVFAPTDDAYVEQTAADTNFGSAPRLLVDASPTDNLLLRFDVATAGCHITHATLRLTVGAGTGDGSLKGGAFSTTATSGWNESTVTWANAPPANPTVVGSLGAVSPGQTYEVDVSSVVTADGPLSLRAGTTSTGAARYVSDEGSTTLGPHLVVTCA
jgi:chitodextrinase